MSLATDSLTIATPAEASAALSLSPGALSKLRRLSFIPNLSSPFCSPDISDLVNILCRCGPRLHTFIWHAGHMVNTHPFSLKPRHFRLLEETKAQRSGLRKFEFEEGMRLVEGWAFKELVAKLSDALEILSVGAGFKDPFESAGAAHTTLRLSELHWTFQETPVDASFLEALTMSSMATLHTMQFNLDLINFPSGDPTAADVLAPFYGFFDSLGDRLTTLHLMGNYFDVSAGEAFGHLANLKTLKLSYISLDALESEGFMNQCESELSDLVLVETTECGFNDGIARVVRVVRRAAPCASMARLVLGGTWDAQAIEDLWEEERECVEQLFKLERERGFMVAGDDKDGDRELENLRARVNVWVA